MIIPNIVLNFKNAIDNFFHTAVWDNATNPGYISNLLAYTSDAFIGFGYLFIILTGILLRKRLPLARYCMLGMEISLRKAAFLEK